MAQRLLFLDLDGVLFPEGSYSHLSTSWILNSPDEALPFLVKTVDPVAVETFQRFREALEREGTVSVVLISTWRHLFQESFLFKFMKEIGAPIDAIAVSALHSAKSRDIAWFLDETDFRGEWYVIDNEDILSEKQKKDGIHIKPNEDIGLRPIDFEGKFNLNDDNNKKNEGQ